jgi:hypothetical protein
MPRKNPNPPLTPEQLQAHMKKYPSGIPYPITDDYQLLGIMIKRGLNKAAIALMLNRYRGTVAKWIPARKE